MKAQFGRRIYCMLAMACLLGALLIPVSAQASPTAAYIPGSLSQYPLGPNSSVLAYAINGKSSAKFEVFDPSVPGTLNEIKNYQNLTVWGGAFLRGDSSKMYVLNYASNNLLTINTTTGAFTTVGPALPVTGQGWSGLSASVDGNSLVAVSTEGSCVTGTTVGASSLYSINPNTGAATLIGPVNNAPCLLTIAVSPRGMIFGVDVGLGNLIVIDPATGASTINRSLGYDVDVDVSLAFERRSGKLYLASHEINGGTMQLYTLGNIYSGTADIAVVGSFPYGSSIFDMTFPIDSENWQGPPDKIAPLNGAAGVTTHPTLAWQLSGMSDTFEYCLTTTVTSSGSTCDTGWKSAGANTSVYPSGLITGKTYFWQVRANGTGGTTYADGDAWWSFTTAAHSLFLPSVRK
jgi:hypothetical protein